MRCHRRPGLELHPAVNEWRSFAVDGTDQDMNLIHIGIEFEREPGPVEILQSFALLGEHGKARLFEEADLAVLDEAVVQAAHAAEQVAELYDGNQAGMLARYLAVVVLRHDLPQV